MAPRHKNNEILLQIQCWIIRYASSLKLFLYNHSVSVWHFQSGKNCFCENDHGYRHYGNVSDSECNQPCLGDRNETCGGTDRMQIYSGQYKNSAQHMEITIHVEHYFFLKSLCHITPQKYHIWGSFQISYEKNHKQLEVNDVPPAGRLHYFHAYIVNKKSSTFQCLCQWNTKSWKVFMHISVCPHGHFKGTKPEMNCDNVCHCKELQCLYGSGFCPDGCKDGWTGTACEIRGVLLPKYTSMELPAAKNIATRWWWCSNMHVLAFKPNYVWCQIVEHMNGSL